jgi:hypothetical protein
VTSLGGSPELAARQVLTRALEHVVGSTVNVSSSDRPWDHHVFGGFKSWFADWHCRLVFFQEGNERNTAPFEGFDPLALEHSEMSEMH